MKKLIGNAVVGQSGGPTAAINATLAGVIRGVKEDVGEGAIRTLYGMRNGVEGLIEDNEYCYFIKVTPSPHKTFLLVFYFLQFDNDVSRCGFLFY